jgi:hypothetical protein
LQKKEKILHFRKKSTKKIRKLRARSCAYKKKAVPLCCFSKNRTKNVIIKYTKHHETDRFKCLDGMYGIDFLYPGDERRHRILSFGGLPPAGTVL